MSVFWLSALDWAEQRVPSARKLARAWSRVRARSALAGCELGRRVMVFGALKVKRSGRIIVGERCVFVAGPVPTAMEVASGATLRLGPRCHFNYGAHFEVHQSIRLGERCMLGSYAHLVDAVGAPVVLGNDVWVAHGALVKPGVTIGDGAVIAAGSVVTTDVPAGMLAMGNPARIFSQQLSVT